jgi:hypothetical protein
MANQEYSGGALVYGSVHKYDKCPFASKSLSFVIDHTRRHHFKQEIQESSTCETTTLEKYYCKSCNFETDLIIIFNQHAGEFHGKECEYLHGPWRKDHCAVKSYICKICTFETHSILFWMKHLESSCFNKSDRFEDLKLSFVTLTDNQWYPCDSCQYRTWRKGNLKRHLLFKHTTSEAVQV